MKNISLLMVIFFISQIHAMEEKSPDNYYLPIILDGPHLNHLQAHQVEEPYNVIVFQDPISKEYKNVYNAIVQHLQVINPENSASLETLNAIFIYTNILKKIQSTIDDTLLLHTYAPNDEYNIFKEPFYNSQIPEILGIYLKISKNTIYKEYKENIAETIQIILQKGLINLFVLEYLYNDNKKDFRNKSLEYFVINLITNTMEENTIQTINIPITTIPIEKDVVGEKPKREAFVHYLTEKQSATNFTKKLIKNGITVDCFKGEGKNIIFQISLFKKEDRSSKNCAIQ